MNIQQLKELRKNIHKGIQNLENDSRFNKKQFTVHSMTTLLVWFLTAQNRSLKAKRYSKEDLVNILEIIRIVEKHLKNKDSKRSTK